MQTEGPTVPGDHILFDEQYIDWEPLRSVIPQEEYGDWMWMHAVDGFDGERVHFYKHVDTRRYVRLDRRGRIYAEDSSGRPHRLRLRAQDRDVIITAAKTL